MRKWLILLLLAAAAAPVSASVTAFSATLKRSDGTVPKVFLRLSIVNCGTYNPYVSGDHVIANPDGSFDLFPNTTTGVISVNVDDEASIVCGISTGVSYYHIATYQGDQTTSTARRKITECDYDITGGTFNMNTATCKAAGSVTAPSLALQKVQNEGSDLSPTRGKINFFNGLKATDNSGSQRDDVTLNFGQKVVDGTTYANIQAAITAASTTGYVIIPANYAGSDVYTNPNSIQIIDLRGKPDRQDGFVNALTACGLKGDGATDDGSAINSCLQTWGQLGRTVRFPKTAATATGCDYFSTVTLIPYGSIEGEGSIWQNGTGLTNTNICFASGVTGVDLEINNCRGSCSIRNLGFEGGDDFGNLATTTKFIIPKASALTDYDRSNSSIQRASNVLTVTVKKVNGVGEQLFQKAGSTVSINGVVGDSTMNGLCIIATLSGGSYANDNYSTFTCPQNGADAGPFTNDGKVSLPTTGLNISDGIRVCGNFYVFDHISVKGFARWGINGDANTGEGCGNLFADDLTVRESSITNNQVGGFFTRGADSNVDLFIGNSFYYNGGMAIVDESALGNTYIGNNISNNGALWISGGTPATKSISSISRTIASNSSTASVVLATADVNIKVGSCVTIAGVTDSSFNNTAGQCYFVTSVADSTHYSYIQPGAPANASSSGGTSRIATWAENYLSSGLDSGAFKMALGASASSDDLLLNNYVEGAQPCKLGNSVLYIQGTNGCGGSLNGTFISTQTFASSTAGTNITDFGNVNDNTGGYDMAMHAGLTASNHEYIDWDTFNNVRAFRLDVLPTGAAGITGYWQLTSDGASNTRIAFNGSSGSGIAGSTYLNAVGTAEVMINRANAGTASSGGLGVYNGASTKVGGIDGAGISTGAAFKSTTANPASAGAVRLAKTDVIGFRNNANSADITALSLNGSDQEVLPTLAATTSAVSFTAPAYISSTANPAAAGVVRLAKTDAISFRNNANGADVNGISLNASDQVQCGGSAGCVDSNSNKFGTIIASGTSALGTGAISATTCATVVTTAATNTATTDAIEWAFNAAPGTGYTSGVHVLAYPTSGNVNFLVCNPTAGSLTPAAATLNWKVIR